MFNVNIRQVIHILELTGTFTCTWPLDPNSSKREIVYRNIRWAFAMFNVIFLMISLVLAVFHFRNDVIVLMKTASEMTALLEVFFDLLICKMKNAQLQVLIEKIKAYLEVIGEQESKIIQGYIDRYQNFFSVTAMSYVVTAISFSFVPLFSAQELPADGWIPFTMEPFAVYWLIYASQVYCILQTAFCIGVDFTIAVLFTYAAAKLDILGMKLRQVHDRDMLSLRFAKSLGEISWLGKPRDMTKIIVIMMQRSQKLFLIRMGGLLPALTLEYYANFLTTVSSYFMAMRTMIES